MLLLSGLLPLALALVLLAEVLGASRPPGNGGFAWTFAVEGLVAVACARRAELGGVHVDRGARAERRDRGVRDVGVPAARAGHVPRDARRDHVWMRLPGQCGCATASTATRCNSRMRRGWRRWCSARRSWYRLSGSEPCPAGAIARPVRRGRSAGSSILLAVGFGSLAYAAADREPGPAYIGVAVLGGLSCWRGLRRALGPARWSAGRCSCWSSGRACWRSGCARACRCRRRPGPSPAPTIRAACRFTLRTRTVTDLDHTDALDAGRHHARSPAAPSAIARRRPSRASFRSASGSRGCSTRTRSPRRGCSRAGSRTDSAPKASSPGSARSAAGRWR